MGVMFLAAMIMAQAPSAAQPALALPSIKVKKQKAPQICEDVELTGSRAKRHVCHDANVDTGTLLGVSHSFAGKGSMSTGNGGPANTGTGGPGGSN